MGTPSISDENARISGASTIGERYVHSNNDYYDKAEERRISEISTVSTLTEEYEIKLSHSLDRARLRELKQRQRLHSHSCEDLTQYSRMSMAMGPSYDNETFRLSDESACQQLGPNSQIYSYARPIDIEMGYNSYSSESYMTGSPQSIFGQSPGNVSAYSTSPTKPTPWRNPPNPSAHLAFSNRGYMNRPGRLRKSMSNPDLLERELRMPYPGQPKPRRPTVLDLPTPPPVPMLRKVDKSYPPPLDFSLLSKPRQKQQNSPQSSSAGGATSTRRSGSPVSMQSRLSYESNISDGNRASGGQQTFSSSASFLKGITFTAKTKSFVKSPPIGSAESQRSLQMSHSSPYTRSLVQVHIPNGSHGDSSVPGNQKAGLDSSHGNSSSLAYQNAGPSTHGLTPTKTLDGVQETLC